MHEASDDVLRVRELERRNSFLYEQLRRIHQYRWHLNNVFKTDRQIAEDVFAMVEDVLRKETDEITAETLRAMEQLERGESV